MSDCVPRLHGVSLRDLLPDAIIHGARDIRVTSCCGDSRRCLPGDLFVSLVGGQYDGHNFVRDAMSRGAAAVLAERIVPVAGLPTCVVPDTRIAYARLCQALAGDPSQRVKVIGVTGTNGKTTTTQLIAGILQAAGCRVGRLGTLGYSDSVESAPAVLTTPSAPVLAHWLARMEANGCTHAVMEVSSHALAQSRVTGVTFDAACVTNVRRDHLDFHGSLENYRAAKARLFDHLAADAFTVINADDPGSAGFLSLLHGPALTVAMNKPAELTGTLLERFASEQTFLLTAGNDTVPVRTPTIGDHNIYNCLEAAAVGLAYGVDLSTVVRGLENAAQVPGRLERIDCGQPFGVFVDYAHTPDALAATLSSLREVTDGKLICVFGAGGQRDRGKRPLMGRSVERLADLAVVTSDNPRDEEPHRIIQDILRGFENRGEAHVLTDRAEAIRWALNMAQPGDNVLIAGKGHETYQIIGRGRYHFDDREVARRWLYSAAPTGDLVRAG